MWSHKHVFSLLIWSSVLSPKLPIIVCAKKGQIIAEVETIRPIITGPTSAQQTPPNSENCVCVFHYQCDRNYTIITSGEGIIDERYKQRNNTLILITIILIFKFIIVIFKYLKSINIDALLIIQLFIHNFTFVYGSKKSHHIRIPDIKGKIKSYKNIIKIYRRQNLLPNYFM